MLHGKLKQSEAKYSAIRDLMAGDIIMVMIVIVTLKNMHSNYFKTEHTEMCR